MALASRTPLFMGIFFAVINAFMLAAMSLFAKLLAAHFGPVEVTFFRNAFSLFALLMFLIFASKLSALKTERPIAHLFRGIIGTVGIVLGAWAVSLMPLSETIILLFTAPLFVVLLSYPVLGEPVGIYRLSAVFVGFIGVVIMTNPTAGFSGLPPLGIALGLGWGFFAGCVDLCLRWMGKTENSTTTVFYFVLFGTLTTALHWPFAPVHEGSFSIDALWIIVGLGMTGLLSLLAKTQSYRLAEASLIAPVMYSMIVWTMLFDYAFWGKEPGWNVILGSAIIIGSNLFILKREQMIKAKSPD